MKLRPLGNTAIEVFPVILGCGSFGGVGSMVELIGHGLDEAASMAAMDEASALGINVFDTACSYTGGASERYIGRWLAAQPPDVAERIHIATKTGVVPRPGAMDVDLSPANIALQLEGSLERLGLERVDLCLSHAPDAGTPIEATLEGYAAQIEAGRIGWIGACNVSVAQLEEALLASERLDLPRYEWVQNEYNLMHREDEGRLFALCREHKVGYTPFSPMAGGVLSGKYRRDQPAPEGSRLALRPEGHTPSAVTFDAIDHLAALAQKHGWSTGALALAWVLTRPEVSSLIAGPSRSPEHLRLAREALGITLSEQQRADIGHWFEAQVAN